jgi:hypothetical protein
MPLAKGRVLQLIITFSWGFQQVFWRQLHASKTAISHPNMSGQWRAAAAQEIIEGHRHQILRRGCNTSLFVDLIETLVKCFI